MTQYAKGDTVYLTDGTECEFIGAFDNRYLVYLISTRGYDGEVIADPTIVTEIYDSPPIVKRSEKISRLDRLIEEKEKKLREMETEQRHREAENKRMAAIIAKHEALQLVDAFLERRVTHMVSISEYGQIQLLPLEEAMHNPAPWDGGMRLLSLFGKSGGDLQWRLNKYSTEGEAIDAYPFFSLEAARAFLQTRIDDLTGEHVLNKNEHRLDAVLQSVEKINARYDLQLHIPEYVRKYQQEILVKQLVRREKDLVEALADIRKKLQELGHEEHIVDGGRG